MHAQSSGGAVIPGTSSTLLQQNRGRSSRCGGYLPRFTGIFVLDVFRGAIYRCAILQAADNQYDRFAIPTKSVKSQYKYRIISSGILLKISKFISIDICIDFTQ